MNDEKPQAPKISSDPLVQQKTKKSEPQKQEYNKDTKEAQKIALEAKLSLAAKSEKKKEKVEVVKKPEN